MTEREWLTSNDPRAMLEKLTTGRMYSAAGENLGKVKCSDRKLRLFFHAAACPRCRDLCMGMPIAERARYAAEASCGERGQKAALLRDIFGNPYRPVVLPTKDCPNCDGFGHCNLRRDLKPGDELWEEYVCPDCKGSGEMTDCPWLTPAVQAIAQTIDAERRFEELPVLADALTEAGCPERVTCHGCNGDGGFQANSTWVPCELCAETADESTWTQIGTLENPIIAHLRGPGPHVRGCWALDLIRGQG